MRETHIGGPNQCRVVILAPTWKDAGLIHKVLTKEGLHPHICQDWRDMRETLSEGVGMLLLAQEALTAEDLEHLADVLPPQEAWSDIPITVLTAKGASYGAIHHLIEQVSTLGSVTLLERPIQSFILVSVVRMALRSRQRQYQVRDLLRRLDASQSQLQDKIADLEQFERVVVGRELKMIDLEKQIHKLHEEITSLKAGSSRGQAV